jgi:mono/diheme cytochrome c family protein
MKTLKDKWTMTISNRALALAAATLALIFAGSAAAQDNYDQGKTGPQLFASDCGICHESPRGLMKTVSPSGLTSFLSVHYTASGEVAARIAAYLTSVDQGGPAPERARTAKKPKGAEASKSGDKSAGSDAKASDAKASDAKPADSGKSDKP